MTKFFLTAKHWQIFLLFLFGTFNANFTYEGRPTVTIVVRLIGTLISFSWVLFVGHGLYNYLPKKIHFNYNLFLVNFFICLTAYTTVMILSDGDGMTFNGLPALPGFYVFYALLYITTFPGRLLKSIEIDEKAKLGGYIGNFFLLIFWPIGIWFLQPRINKVVAGQDANQME